LHIGEKVKNKFRICDPRKSTNTIVDEPEFIYVVFSISKFGLSLYICMNGEH